MPTPSELYELYLINNTDDARLIELIEISHPSLTETFLLTPTPEPVSLTLENGSTITPRPVNMSVKKSSSRDDLDERFTFTISDIYGQLNDQADLIPLDDQTPVTLTYRGFISSDTSEPSEGPYILQISSMTQTTDGAVSLEAQSPSLVVNRTGELYTYDRFPMLRGFL